MTQALCGLEDIIAPFPLNTFVEQYLNRKAVHIPGDINKFGELYDWNDINYLLNHGRPSLEAVMLLYDKQKLPRECLLNLTDWLVKGATITINFVDQIDPVVSQLASSIASDMNTRVNVNCYASYPSAQGFDTHYDGHDVLIVQTAGEKKWTVYEPTVRWPLDVDKRPKGDLPQDAVPYLECDLSPGDVLYIPRGHWHCAIATSPSVHLTVGTKPRCGIEYLTWLTTQLLENDEFLREDFPVVRISALGGDRKDDQFMAHISKFQERMHELLDDESLVESFVHYCMLDNPIRRTFQLPALGILDQQIQPGTRLQMSENQKCLVRYDPETKTAVILIRGHAMRLNNITGELLSELVKARDRAISGAEISARCPDVEWEHVQPILTRLVKEGVLNFVGPDGGTA